MISFFEIWVSSKYLFQNKRKIFFTYYIISFGISLGVATLIIVMSVMNGFREELTSKVLGINGHLKIKSIFNEGIQNNDNFGKTISDNFKNIKVHNIILSQGLITYKGYSNGILKKVYLQNILKIEEMFKKNYR